MITYTISTTECRCLNLVSNIIGANLLPIVTTIIYVQHIIKLSDKIEGKKYIQKHRILHHD